MVRVTLKANMSRKRDVLAFLVTFLGAGYLGAFCLRIRIVWNVESFASK